MADIKKSLADILKLDGAMCVSLVDSKSGMILGEDGSGLDMELAAAGNSEVVKAKLATIQSLQLNETIEDMLISLDSQYHIIRPLAKHTGLFMYVVLDKEKSNLALARRKVQNVENTLTL